LVYLKQGAISYDQLDAELGEDDEDSELPPRRRSRLGSDYKDDMDIDEDSGKIHIERLCIYIHTQ